MALFAILSLLQSVVQPPPLLEQNPPLHDPAAVQFNAQVEVAALQ